MAPPHCATGSTSHVDQKDGGLMRISTPPSQTRPASATRPLGHHTRCGASASKSVSPLDTPQHTELDHAGSQLRRRRTTNKWHARLSSNMHYQQVACAIFGKCQLNLVKRWLTAIFAVMRPRSGGQAPCGRTKRGPRDAINRRVGSHGTTDCDAITRIGEYHDQHRSKGTMPSPEWYVPRPPRSLGQRVYPLARVYVLWL